MVLGLAIGLMISGWRLGFARRVFSWAGLLAGALIAAWILPRLIDTGPEAATPNQFLLAVGVLMLGAAVGQVIGWAIGSRLKGVIADKELGLADSVLGVVAGLIGLVLVLWILLPAMADVPGWPAQQARDSEVAAAIDGALGAPPPVLDGLAETLGVGSLPRVFDGFNRAPEVSPPPADSAVSAEVMDTVSRSVVKVQGPGCGQLQSGTGFLVSDGLVVTNAHVIAGTGELTIETADGQRFAGATVAFDPDADLAVVSVPGLDRPGLALATGSPGDEGVVLGFPGGGGLEIDPYRIEKRVRADGRDIYDEDRVVRPVFVLSAALAAGNSGGPLVDPDGRVVGVAFAIAPDRGEVAYAVTHDQVIELLDTVEGRGVETSTGRCLH